MVAPAATHHGRSGTDFLDAQTTQWLWKTEAMQRMAIALVELALSHDEFAADDLPPTLDHGGSGIAGRIMSKLADNGIITRVGVNVGTEFFPEAAAQQGRGPQRLEHRRLEAGRPREGGELPARQTLPQGTTSGRISHQLNHH